jgi:uncharacterized membrane protein YgcG
MSPIDIRAARSKFLRAFAAALAVAAVVAGSAFAVTKHPAPHGKAEPWIAESAKQRAQLNAALAVMETTAPPAAWTYTPLKIKRWHRPAPRVVVLAPRVVVVSRPVTHVTAPRTSDDSKSSKSDDSSNNDQTQSSDDGGGDDGGTSGDGGGSTGGDN